MLEGQGHECIDCQRLVLAFTTDNRGLLHATEQLVNNWNVGLEILRAEFEQWLLGVGGSVEFGGPRGEFVLELLKNIKHKLVRVVLCDGIKFSFDQLFNVWIYYPTFCLAGLTEAGSVELLHFLTVFVVIFSARKSLLLDVLLGNEVVS